MPVDFKRAEAVFLAAVEVDDPAGRAAVLDRECSSDPGLKRWVESLLWAHERRACLVPTPFVGTAGRDVGIDTRTDDGSSPSRAAEPSQDFTVAYTSTARGEPAVGETAAGDVPATPAIADGPGTRIGPYTLRQKLGEGGMGAVYLAEQERPVRRQVALKIIKPGMDSEQVIARFEAERQALAMMDHPNIARVLDAGMADNGRPYFVMELVHGIPITEYCDQARLTPRERLTLFIPVCRAIQHAHQKGVIHRDIKPSNVLVTLYDGKTVPKVIDFGIAKAIDQPLTERAMFTQYGVIVGTLEYMSPEQAEGSDLGVDTRSDIYSLGVVLYELLTGSTPLDRARLRETGYPEILKRIREEEPPKPSTRLGASNTTLAAISALRKTEPARLPKLMRGEIDWIVMKALEKDRARRYETVGGLARDIERHLDGEAVEACPPSAGYRLRKFASRHRAALAVASAFATLLALGAALSIWQALVATQARDRADREARRALAAEGRSKGERDRAVAAEAQARAAEAQAKAEGEKAGRSAAEARAVLGFFEDNVLAAARPQGQGGGLGKDVTLRAAVYAAEPRIAQAFRDQPTVEAYIRDSLGVTYRYLGDPALTVRQHERALELRTAALGADHPDTLSTRNNLAVAYQDNGRLDLAIPLYERTLAARAAALGPDHRDTLTTQNNLAVAYRGDGRLDRAIPMFERTLAARTARLGPDHPTTLTTQNNLASAYQDNGRVDLAIPMFERTLADRTARLGADHPDTLTTRNDLAVAYQDSGRLDRAIPMLERTLVDRAARLGADHPSTLTTQNNLASAFRAVGQFDRAILLLERTLAAQTSKLGADHPTTLRSQYNLAMACKDAGRLDRAVALFERTLAAQTSRLGPDHPRTLTTENNLALAYRDAGQYERAITLFEKTRAVETARLGDGHPDTLSTRNNLALTYRDDSQWDRAIVLFEQTLAARTSKLGADHPDTLLTQQNLAMAHREAGRWGLAIELFERTLAAQTSKLGADHPYTLLTQNNLGPAYQAVGQVDRAVELLERTLAARVAKLGADHPSTLTTRNNLALAYQDAGRLDRAIALFERTLADRAAKHGEDHPRTLTTRYDLAAAYEARGDTGRVEPMLREVIVARKKTLGAGHPDVAQALSALGADLLRQRKWAEAGSLLREGLAIRDRKRPDDWSRFETRSLLGFSLLGRENYAEAEPLLLSGYEGMKARESRIPAPSKVRLTEAGRRVVRLYEAWGKPDRAAAWRARLGCLDLPADVFTRP